MKTKRCKYGHKMERKSSIISKLKNFNYDKFFVLSTVTAFIGYVGFLDIFK